MIDLLTLGVFAAACLALTATPGPDMLLIASRSVGQGQHAGFVTLAGVQAGTYCHALAAAFGLSQLFIAVPLAYDIVRYAGAAYLLYLAFGLFRSRGPDLMPEMGARAYGLRQIFWQGLLTNLLNPKMALFVLALFPQFVDLERGSVALQILILATVLNVVGLVVNGAVIVMAGRLGTAMTRRWRYRALPQWLLGSVFVGLALRLVFDERR
jgi:threonine/homoserine/homoserine lactone efflux protein